MRRPASVKAFLSLAIFFLFETAVQAQGFAASFGASDDDDPPVVPIFLKLGIEVGAAIAGFAVGAFLSPMFKPARRFLLAAAFLVGVAFTWISQSESATVLTGWIAMFAFAFAFGLGIKLGMGDEEPDRPSSFGTAKWATEAYLEKFGLFEGRGFLLGEFTGVDRRPLHYKGARHLLTVAPTRSGKGVSSIIPNLLTYTGSAFVIDPKGENALISAVRRSAGDPASGMPGMNQDVFLLDPWNIAAAKLGTEPACFNPLDWITADDPDAVENAFLLADALVASNAGGGDTRFWDEESKALLVGLILYVATSKNEAANRHLGRVRDILLLNEEKLKDVLRAMYKEPNPIVVSTATRTAGKEDKLLSNVFAAAQSHTHFLDSPRIRASLARSDFRFEDLKTRRMSVYLILPADRLDTFGRWLRLLIQQALTVNARSVDEKPEQPVLFLLDEMAALGRLAMVEQAFGLMAGFGMQLWGIVQDLSQLERIYGKGWQTFISNSGVLQYFGSRDQMTAEYFSKLCGVTTIRKASLSDTLARTFGKDSNSSTESHTIGSDESQRQLAYADELMVLKGHQQVVFVDNLDPIRAEKIEWYSDSRLKSLGVDLRAAPARIAPAAPSARAANPIPAQPPPVPAGPKVVQRYAFTGMTCALFDDGSLLAETPNGTHRFASLAELKAHLAATGASAGADGDNAPA